MGFLATNQRNILNSSLPSLLAAGLSLGDLLESMLQSIADGNLGIAADSGDVDSLALGGGCFSLDPDTTAGLVFGYQGGRVYRGLTVMSVAPGVITLSASNTNYIEVDGAGTVYANTSAFASGRLPLWVVTTSGSAIITVTSAKALLTLLGPAAVVGSMLSTMAATKELEVHVGDLAATAPWRIQCPGHAGTISGLRLVGGTTIAADNTNYWTFGAVNKGTGGAGTAVIVDGTAAVNSTKITGSGVGLTANVPRALTLTSTGADLIHAANDVILVTATMVGSPATIAGVNARADSIFTG